MVQRDAITVLQCITALSWCSAIKYFNMPKTFKRRIDSNSTVPICIYRLYRCLVDSDVLILVAQRCLRSSLYSITFSMGLFRIMELSLRARFTHDLCWPETGWRNSIIFDTVLAESHPFASLKRDLMWLGMCVYGVSAGSQIRSVSEISEMEWVLRWSALSNFQDSPPPHHGAKVVWKSPGPTLRNGQRHWRSSQRWNPSIQQDKNPSDDTRQAKAS